MIPTTLEGLTLSVKRGKPLEPEQGERRLNGDEDMFTIVTHSDSAAAIALLKGTDLQRRSRHIEIRVEWLRERMLRGHLSLEYAKGSNNPADMFRLLHGAPTSKTRFRPDRRAFPFSHHSRLYPYRVDA